MGNLTRIAVVFGLLITWPAGVATAQDSGITPGQLRTDPTYEHIGGVWFVSGDTDGDSTVFLRRALG